MQLLNESPIPPKNSNNNPFLYRKIDQISDNLKKTFQLVTDEQSNFDDDSENFRNLIELLRAKFNDPQTEKSEKIQILTLLPMKWSERKIGEAMNTTRYMARLAKKLTGEKGILSTPESKLGIGNLKYIFFVRLRNLYLHRHFY